MRIYNNPKIVAFFLGKDFYSNFYKSDIPYDGKIFHCGEALFMYLKATYFEDYEAADYIVDNSNNPQLCKKIGRTIRGFDDQEWKKVRFAIMTLVALLKLRHSIAEKTQRYVDLIDEGYSFVEANPYDRIWGCGLSESDPNILIRHTWKGKNLLGKVYDNVWRILDESSINSIEDILKLDWIINYQK